MIPVKRLQAIVLAATAWWVVNPPTDRVILISGIATLVILCYCFIYIMASNKILDDLLYTIQRHKTPWGLPEEQAADEDAIPVILALFALLTATGSSIFLAGQWLAILYGASISLLLSTIGMLCKVNQSRQNDFNESKIETGN